MHNNSIIKGDNYEHLHVPLLPVWLLNFCIIATSHSAWYSCFVHLSCRDPFTQQLPSNVATHHLTKPTKATQQLPSSSPSIQLTLHPFTKPSSWTTLTSLMVSPCLFHNQAEILLAISQWYKVMNKIRDTISKTRDTCSHCLRKKSRALADELKWGSILADHLESLKKKKRYEKDFIGCTLGKCRWQNICSTNVLVA